MANGFAPYLLKSLRALAGQNYPGLVLTPAGFTAMLLENSNIREIKLTNEQGHQKTAKVKYKTRQTPSAVGDGGTCDINFSPAYLEADVTAINDKALAFHISRETVSKYMEEASNPQNIGNPSVPVIAEIADSIAHCVNSIVGAIDLILLNSVVWGNNAVTGNNNAVNLNISKDATKMNLDQGFAKLLSDAFENEFQGNVLIVGSGKFNAYELQKRSGVMAAAAQNGIDISRFTGYRFYPDLYARSQWGVDRIGVFAPGSIHMVDFNRYVGFQAGKFGNSTFFQLTLPVDYGFGQTDMTFDCQLKELDCPTELLNAYGEPQTYAVGYGLYIRKTFGLFQTPSNAFSSDDRLTGVNGALRYVVTNECDTCEE